MMNSKDFEGRITEVQGRSRASKSRIKTTSTNSHFNPEKLLETSGYKQDTSMTRINTNKKINKNSSMGRSKEAIRKSFQTVDVRVSKNTIQLSQRSVARVNLFVEEAKELIVLKRFQEAIEILSKALQCDENNWEALFYRGLSYLDSGKPNEAIKDLNKILNIKPEHKKLVYLVLSIAYKRIDKNLASLETLSKGVKYFPKFSDIYLARAHIYLFLKQYQNALNDFRSFNKYAHKKTAGFLGEGDALKKLGRLTEAIDCYTKIIEDPEIHHSSNPLYTTAIERRALAYFIKKDFKKARDDFEKITNIL